MKYYAKYYNLTTELQSICNKRCRTTQKLLQVAI